MKTLSVRFYKRLILVVLALLILIPTVLSIVLGFQNARLRRALAGGEPGTEDPDPARPTNALELEGAPIDYQLLYPELYGTAEVPEKRVEKSGVVYLTFDCTPGENTRLILDILDDYGVKGTFFVTGTVDPIAPSVMEEIVRRGHTIGLRSYSDSYQEVYRSVDAYLEDFKQIYDLVYATTGVRAEIFRFPGGSINAYSSGIYQELIAEMLRRNFVFFDWNVSGEDTHIDNQEVFQVADNVVNGVSGKDWAIVNLRDSVGKAAATEALPGVIESLLAMGYSLEPLKANVMPVIFSYKNAP